MTSSGRRYLSLLEAKPGGFRIASLMRPPAEGENLGAFVGRARQAAAHGPFGHHIHWTSPTHARPTGPDPAAGVLREGAWLREQGLEPRFFCGGGWYTDAEVMAAAADLGYVDCTATAWRPSYLPPGSPRAELDQPAWVRLVDGRRLLELPTTHSLGAIARSLHRSFRRSSMCTSTTTSCSTAAAVPRSSRRCACSPGAGARPGSTSSLPNARFPGTLYARAELRPPGRGRGRRRARGLRRLASSSRGISLRIDTNPFRITVLRDGKTVVAEDEHARLRYQLTSTGDQYFLTKVISKQGDTYRVATSEPGGHRTATVKVRQTATGADLDLVLHPGTGRAAGLRRLRLVPPRALPRRRRERRGGRPPRPDPRRRGRLPVLVHADPVLRKLGGLGSPTREPEPGSDGICRLARRGCLSDRTRPCLLVPAAPDENGGLPPGRRAARAPLRRVAGPDVRRLPGRDGRARGAAAFRARVDQVAGSGERARGHPAGHLPVPGGGDPARLGAARQPVGAMQRRAHLRQVADPRSGRPDPGSPCPRRPFHALDLAPRDLPAGLPRQAARGARLADPGSARPLRGRRVPAAHPCARRARGRRREGRPRRRERPAGCQPLPDERLPAAVPACGDGCAAEGRRGDLPCRDGRLPGRRARDVVGRPARGVGGAPAGDRSRADDRDERLSDLGLRHRRIPGAAVRDARAVRALGPVRGGLAGDGGRRRRRQLDAVDARRLGDGGAEGGGSAALRALPVPLRPAAAAPAGAPSARVRLPGRPEGVGRELRDARRPGPARGPRLPVPAPRRPSTCRRAPGSISTPARRSRAPARSRARHRSTSSPSMSGTGRSSRSTCERRPDPGGG